jgi:hypothetical protein
MEHGHSQRWIETNEIGELMNGNGVPPSEFHLEICGPPLSHGNVHVGPLFEHDQPAQGECCTVDGFTEMGVSVPGLGMFSLESPLGSAYVAGGSSYDVGRGVYGELPQYVVIADVVVGSVQNLEDGREQLGRDGSQGVGMSFHL